MKIFSCREQQCTSFEKSAAKDAAKEYVEARQNALFKDDLNQKSTLRDLKTVVDVNAPLVCAREGCPRFSCV